MTLNSVTTADSRCPYGIGLFISANVKAVCDCVLVNNSNLHHVSCRLTQRGLLVKFSVSNAVPLFNTLILGELFRIAKFCPKKREISFYGMVQSIFRHLEPVRSDSQM